MIVDLNNKENNKKNQRKDNETENNTEKSNVGDCDNNDNDDESGPSFDVLFPYDRIYPEQYRFLKCVKRALFKKGHALIEAPPGTNQSLCLLSLLTSYQQQGQEQQHQPNKALDANHNHDKNDKINSQRKIVYATNSVPETIKAARELAVIMDYRQQQHQRSCNSDNNSNIHSAKKRPQQHQVLFQNIEDGFWKPTNGVGAIDESSLIQDYNENYANRIDSLPFLALCLKGSDRDIIDDACRTESSPTRVDSDAEQQNPPPLNGIFTSLEQLHTWAALNVSSLGKCWASPQQLTKYAILHANVLVVTYPFLLDPMTAMIIGSAVFDSPQQQQQQTNSKENNTATNANDADQTKMQTEDTEKGTKEQEKSALSQTSCSDAVIVFDHAHNIDAAGMDALSATVNLLDLEQATRSLDKLSSEITRFKQHQHSHHNSDTRRADESSESNIKSNSSSSCRDNLPLPLKYEYDNLVRQPIDRGMYRPILFPSDDVVKEPVPGNIRHMKHFIGCMKKIVEHFKNRLRLATEVKQQQSSRSDNGGHKSKKKKMGTGSVSPLAFLHQMMNATALDSKTLRFVHSRVLSMLRTLNLSKDHFVGLLNVAYSASLLGFTNTLESSKFAIVLEQTSVVIGHHRQSGNSFANANAMMLQVACLDPALAIRPIFERFNTVILTSSTLSPLSFYPKILQFKPVVAESIPMTTIRPCIIPMMISRGSDQLGISTSYKERFTMGCIRNYGKMLVDLVSSIPDGIVVYFPSYNYMEALICEWDATGIMREMTEWKLIFVETKDNLELNAIALDNYRASCDIGRGGVFFSVSRGNISEAVPFDLHYGRASVMIGIPYEYTLSKVVQARLEYIQTQFDIREQDYLTFDAVRQVAKCFGRVIRSKTDYGVLIFADNRFHRNDKRSKLPGWVTQFLTDSQQDLTTDSAVAQIKTFLRQTGQPVDQNLLQDVLAKK